MIRIEIKVDKNWALVEHIQYDLNLNIISAYFCPHLMFNFGYLIEFVCLKIDLIGFNEHEIHKHVKNSFLVAEMFFGYFEVC